MPDQTPAAPYRPIPDDDEFIDILQNGSMYAEVIAFLRLVATLGTEQAYRRWVKLQSAAWGRAEQDEIKRLDVELKAAWAEVEQLRACIDRVTLRLRTDDPRAMINQRQVLGLLSPTWPNGNYSNEDPS